MAFTKKTTRRVFGWQRDGRLVCRGSHDDRYLGSFNRAHQSLTCTCPRFVYGKEIEAERTCPHLALYAEYLETHPEPDRATQPHQWRLWHYSHGSVQRVAYRREHRGPNASSIDDAFVAANLPHACCDCGTSDKPLYGCDCICHEVDFFPCWNGGKRSPAPKRKIALDDVYAA